MKRMKLFMMIPFLMLSVITGCVREQEFENFCKEPEYPTEGKAAIKMSVALPGLTRTRAMGDNPDITSLHVLIFGSSGFLKEVIELDPAEYEAANTNTDLYEFTVHPSLTDSKNLRIHVIANFDEILPWKYEDEIMTTYAYTTGDQDAYWCRFTLPNGIELQKEYNEEEDRMVYVKQGDFYVVTDAVSACFDNLALIRNFAKVSVESTTPQLVLNEVTTMAVINRPDRGSVAPYHADSLRLVTDYKEYRYDDLKEIYPGFSPVGVRYVDDDPSKVAFTTCKRVDGNIIGGVYMYERPAPKTSSDNPSYLIIHGMYYPLLEGATREQLASDPDHPELYIDYGSGQDGYYKIDFMDEDGYYAILRNFRYHIRITAVSKPGAETAADAGSTGGSGDVSQSTETQGLTDISDGYGRIAVSYVQMTLVDGKPVMDLKYKFIPDIESGDEGINNYLSTETDGQGNPGPVTITIGNYSGPKSVFASEFSTDVANETGTTFGNGTGKIKVLSTLADAEGYRTIHFTVNDPDPVDQSTQTIKITGRINNTTTISREVLYYLMPHQTMVVACEADEPNPDYPVNYVEDAAGEGINVKISIPDQLPESMFPLLFNIESDTLSITPNTAKYPNDNLPVESGYSICPYKTTKSSFHYVKTLSWDDYGTLAVVNGLKTFTCHFKTNKAESAGRVYVSNEYFNTNYARFYNYIMFRFTDLNFSSFNVNANTSFNCTFKLDSRDVAGDRTNGERVITLVLEDCVPQNSNASGWSTIDAASGRYSYTTTAAAGASITLALKTITTAAGYESKYAVSLSSVGHGRQEYHDISIANVVLGISLNKTRLSLEQGSSEILVATVSPDTGPTRTVTWSSKNTSVATVNSSGKVTAVSVGTADITASCGGKEATCRVTVTPVEVISVSLNKSTTKIEVGKTETLVATIAPARATDKSVTWSSSDTGIVTVNSSGVITGVALGTATVTVTTNSGGKVAHCVVNVVPTPVTGVTLNESYLLIAPNATSQLTATVAPANAANKNVTWSSSDTSVATVSDDGLVTAVARGRARITVRTVDGGYTAYCDIRVGTRVTVTTNAININNTTFTSFSSNSASYTNQNFTLSVTNVSTRNANYLEIGYRSGITNYNGTITITPTSALTSLDEFTITGMSFTYDSYNYGRGTVTASAGTYTGPGNNQTTASWNGSTSSAVTFTMASRTSGVTRYWNRLKSITITYSYID